jgi:isopentenyldiphosphate isomerase
LTSPTTDPQDELFDILNERGEPTGVTKPRWQVHRDGDWHGAFHLWLCGVDDARAPFVVFQRRSLTKDSWPGYLDVTVGGHLRAGETLEETAREAEEEIGLSVTIADLVPIGRHFDTEPRDGLIERELHFAYAFRNDAPLASYRLHPEELDALVAIAIPDAIALFEGSIESAPAWEHRRDAHASTTIAVRRADFAGQHDAYPLLALNALAALLNGETISPFEVRSEPN